MSNSKQNIIIACGGTGGHLFPGIAVAQQLKARGYNPVLLISLKEVDADASRKYGDLEFHTVPAIAKPSLLSLRMPGFLWKLVSTYFTCKKIIRQCKADVVLGMGGFTSLPPVRAGYALGLRTYVHDSNALPGKANRMTARWCTGVLLGLEEARHYFPGSQCTVVGTPVRDELVHLPSREEARERLGIPQDKTVILVTGGSQGARNLNTLLVDAAKKDPEVFYLIIAGRFDFPRVAPLAQDAPNVRVIGFCNDMPAAYAASDGVIARSGASTLTELSIIGRACMLVPYPYAADDHQTHNARVFTSRGAAVMCQQSELTTEKVHSFVHDIVMRPNVRTEMEQAILSLSRPNAAADIAEVVTGE